MSLICKYSLESKIKKVLIFNYSELLDQLVVYC